jgi:predicted RNase H-like HicB family nuclease
MLLEYINAALNKAKYEIIVDDNSFYGFIPELQGVISYSDTLESCRQQLYEVVEEWLLIRISKGLPIPIIDNIDLQLKYVA